MPPIKVAIVLDRARVDGRQEIRVGKKRIPSSHSRHLKYATVSTWRRRLASCRQIGHCISGFHRAVPLWNIA